MISFVPQNSEVGGTGIVIGVFRLLGEKLKTTKWLNQVVTVKRQKASIKTPPWPLGWDSQLYFSSKIFISFRLLYPSLRLLLKDFKVFKGNGHVLFIMNFVHTRLDTQLMFIKDNDVLASMP